MIYRDRYTAGRKLAAELQYYADRQDVRILALPRGGLPVAREVARALHVPLDVLIVRKLGLPWQPELAAGAIASGGVRIFNPEFEDYIEDFAETMAPVVQRERQELARREALYRKGLPPLDVRDRTVIVVDDGIATGSTMEAAVQAVRELGARKIVVAVPVASSQACERLKGVADRVVCPLIPAELDAVGNWYEEFPQLSDAEVIDTLAQSAVITSTAEARRTEKA